MTNFLPTFDWRFFLQNLWVQTVWQSHIAEKVPWSLASFPCHLSAIIGKIFLFRFFFSLFYQLHWINARIEIKIWPAAAPLNEGFLKRSCVSKPNCKRGAPFSEIMVCVYLVHSGWKWTEKVSFYKNSLRWNKIFWLKKMFQFQ